jgi:transposase
MEAIIERCCGLDVHQETIVACVLIGTPDERPRKLIRTFGTVTRDLLQLRDWLFEQSCTHVAMESTGIYWRPVHAVLEDALEVVVGNARDMKNRPGRKTDVKDSEWIADLLRHGMIAKSFVPPKPIRDLRDLTRYRRKLTESRTSERNRLLKLLETANIKIASFVSNVFGVSGMQMLKALLGGEQAPDQMADLAKGRLRKKLPQLREALNGRVEGHHRFILKMQLDRLEQLETHITQLERRIEQQLAPYKQQQTLIDEVPGIADTISASIIAEMGPDISVFQSESHLASWAGVSPGNNQSAGKRRRAGARKGNVHLTTVLVEAAQAAIKKKGSYFRDKFHRLKARRGYKRAILAIAHKILRAIYHMLASHTHYRDLGETYLDQIDEHRTAKNLKRRLEMLGYKVSLEKAPA